MTATPSIKDEPRLDYVTCVSSAGSHRMAYWEWGDPENERVLLCVHGLTRTGRDFDPLARALASDYRVVCPDVVGRGRSDWLVDPMAYAVPQYVADMMVLIARLRPAQLDWVGTSMGGLIGLALGGMVAVSPGMRPDRGAFGLGVRPDIPLGKVVLNDVGPTLNQEGLARIADYVGRPETFDSFEQAVEYVRSVSAGFGTHDHAGWEALTRDVFNQHDGRWIKHYDLRMSLAFAAQTPEVLKLGEQLLWQAYENLPGDVLIVHGQKSDLLTTPEVEEMLRRNSRASLYSIPGVGHAPTLRDAEQIDHIRQFLRA
ncbi:MAG: alpha/beta hydrolase [Alcaligenaceae bacterium]|nr:alpha/beta hydrolase [Alcaligenaceae bacterium]